MTMDCVMGQDYVMKSIPGSVNNRQIVDDAHGVPATLGRFDDW